MKLLLVRMQLNIRKSFVGTKYLDIYTLTNNIAYYEKMLVKQVKEKPQRGTYFIGYLYNVVNVYSLINLDSNKEFKEV